jgi:hypothetical protein
MPSLVDSPAELPPAATAAGQAAAERLRSLMAAVRLSFVWLGVRKTLSQVQETLAADAFEAEGEYLSAANNLLDTKHPAFRAVTAVKSRIVAYWRGISLPYPKPGIRLIHQDDIPAFGVQLTTRRRNWPMPSRRSATSTRSSSRLPASGWGDCITAPIIRQRSPGCLKPATTFHLSSHPSTCGSSARSSTPRKRSA